MWNVHIPNSYMENTFGCWSGNVPPVHSTACDWHFRASPLAVMLCHCWQWLHYYSKPEDASGFELLIQLLSKEGKKVVFFSAAKFCCVSLYCSASVLWFSLVFLPGCDTFLNCVSTDSLFAILLIQQSCGCFATVLVLLLERLVERGKNSLVVQTVKWEHVMSRDKRWRCNNLSREQVVVSLLLGSWKAYREI